MRALVFLLVFAQALPAEVLVRAPRTSAIEFKAALKADPDLQAPSDVLASQRPRAQSRELLLGLFATAQKSFLDNSTEDSRAQFERVVSLLLTDDWAKADRQIFHNTYLRLAQLEMDLTKKNIWLNRALLLGDDLDHDETLFPPPLIAQLKQLRAEMKKTTLPTDLWEEGWTKILINGFPCTKSRCSIGQTAEQSRVTFLSDVWQPVTLTIDTQRLRQVDPERLPFATGDCLDGLTKQSSSGFPSAKVFWGHNCEPAKKDLEFRPVFKTNAIPELKIDDNPKAIYKSPWFWAAGAGILATAAILIAREQQQKTQEKTPTTTYGE